MIKVGIIVSHRSIKLGRFPQSTRSMLDTTIAQWNHDVKSSKLGRAEIAFDYEGFRILHQTENSQESIIKRMLELRKEYDLLIYIPLVDKEFGSGMKEEFDAINRLPAKKKPFIEPYIRIRDGYSDSNYPMLLDKNNKKLNVAVWYKDDDDFSKEVYKAINGIVHSYRKRSVWIKLLLALLVLLIAFLLGKQISREDPVSNQSGLPIEQIDSSRVALGNQIDLAKALINQGEKKHALDKLNHLSIECKQEWIKEKRVIDSLLVVAQNMPDSNPPIRYVKNSCQISSNNTYTTEYLKSKLKEPYLGLKFLSSGSAEWVISIEERLRVSSKPYQSVTTYSATITLIARIIKNGKEMPIEPVIGNAISTLGEEQAGDEARKNALDILANKIIEEIRK